jgi:hypothetical protein
MTQSSCLCCGTSWTSEHSRGPLLCELCFHALGPMKSASVYSWCYEHYNRINANEVSPPVTMTNGPYVPLLAR